MVLIEVERKEVVIIQLSKGMKSFFSLCCIEDFGEKVRTAICIG